MVFTEIFCYVDSTNFIEILHGIFLVIQKIAENTKHLLVIYQNVVE